jgi:electron transfer flavoprotein alpha/beta subunit
MVTQQIQTPCVLACIKGPTELRTPGIKGVMAANRATIPTLALASLGLQPEEPLTVNLLPRPARRAGQVVMPANAQDGAQQLAAYLKQEGFAV